MTVEAFGTAMVVIAIVAVFVAVASYWGSGRIYTGLGRSGGLAMDDDGARGPAPAPQSATGQAEAREEIRQMLEAKSARREARGQGPLDVEAELDQLTRPATPRDAALREEVRQLVVARNERRVRQGKDPLDVDSEVERQLRDLGA
ncbi:MAG: hypothetical protein ABR581_08065 [Thermoleophilaceae bacterium]